MSLLMWCLGAASLGAASWYAAIIIRGVLRLRPQVTTAIRQSRQNKAVAAAETIGIDDLMFSAQAGDASAQTRLGLMYATGDGMTRNPKKAFGWFERAAKAEFIDAQYYLGLAYHHGRGVARDAAQARVWYESAARRGNAAAQCNLAILFLKGVEGGPDWVTAAYWFLQAASRKNEEAINNLRWLVKHRHSAPPETSDALAVYQRLAVGGDLDSMFLAGWCYEHGFGVAASHQEALRWYLTAEKAGHLYAHDDAMRLREGDA